MCLMATLEDTRLRGPCLRYSHIPAPRSRCVPMSLKLRTEAAAPTVTLPRPAGLQRSTCTASLRWVTVPRLVQV